MTSSRLSGALSKLQSLNAGSDQPRLVTTNPLLTPEQAQVIESPLGKHVIQAYAGCGKTFLLSQIAKKYHHKQKILYLAFNQSIAHEANALFGKWAKCQTTHALALQWLQRSVRYKKLTERMGEYHILDICKQQALDPKKHLPIAYAHLKTLNNFLVSSDRCILEKHLPTTFLESKNTQEIEVNSFLSRTQQMWDQILNGTSNLGLSHDAYLKLWTLHGAPLDADLVLLDEAQDTNEALTYSLNPDFFYAVGDAHQSIYQFRGAVNALAQIQGATRHSLTVTQRFGGDILNLVNAFLFIKGASEALSSAQTTGSFNAYGIPPASHSMFVSRTNLSIVKKALQCSFKNIPYYIMGSSMSFIAQENGTFELLQRLSERKSIEHPQFGAVYSIEQLEHLSNIAQDNQLNFLIQLFKEYGVSCVEKIRMIEQKQTQSTSAMCLTTVHKSKGLQSPWIELADDFDLSIFSHNAHPWYLEPPLNQEDNVFYVAMTRAQKGLFLPTLNHMKWATAIASSLKQSPSTPSILDSQEALRWSRFFHNKA